ncbi:hypothetical protein [Actinophytocola sp.]|uniref:hypothetical protein n=1 Tax=Actinophytocola sp. TaxID=1872138 RepID=UPI003899D9BF
MRASTKGLLVLLLTLFAATGATASAAAPGYATQGSVFGGPASEVPATHHDLRDWLRLPVAARHALSTPAPDSWCAVCATTAGTSTAAGRPAPVEARAAVAVAVAVTPSTRAPPVRVR